MIKPLKSCVVTKEALEVQAEFVEQWYRTRSVMRLMTEGLRLHIGQADASAESVKPRAIMEYADNIDWLLSRLDEDAFSAADELRAHGFGGEGMIDPIHTETINGQPVRFFPSPANAVQDMPWVAVYDLALACYKAPDEALRFVQAMRGKEYGHKTARISTPDGPAVIFPHWMAAGVALATEEGGPAPAGFYDAYIDAAVRAAEAAVSGLPIEAKEKTIMAMLIYSAREADKDDAEG